MSFNSSAPDCMETTHGSSPQHAVPQDVSQHKHANTAVTALKDIVFGSFAGIVGKVIEYPFDTVKVRLQAQPDAGGLLYSGPVDCFKQALRTDGIKGLYRGVSVPLLGAAAETSSLFFSYRLIQDAVKATIITNDQQIPLSGLIACGALSGTSTSLVLTPIELVKCKMQVPFIESPTAKYPPTVLSIIRDVYAQKGTLGFWHGQMGTLIRETGGSAAWFGSFEGVKLLFKQHNGDADNDLKVWQLLVAGASAGVSYNFFFYPADTIKSRMQTEDVFAGTEKKSFWKVGADLWKSQGLRGYYRGCGITVARAIPSSALIFTIHDALMKYFK